MKKIFVFLMVLFTILASCKKEDEGSRSETITSGKWKLTAYRTDYEKDGEYEEDTYAKLAVCEKDNIYSFLSNGDLIKDEGPTKCIDSNPQTITSAWSFQDNKSSLLWGGSKYKIEELSATTLTLKQRTSYNVIFTIDIILTFSNQ